MKKQTTQSIKILILGLTIGLGVFITSAFTAPTTAPGTVAPSLLNQEPENQVKGGSLGVGSFLVSDYGADFWAPLIAGVSGNIGDALDVGYSLGSNGNPIIGTGSELNTSMTVSGLATGLTNYSSNLCATSTGELVVCDPQCGTAKNVASFTAPTDNFCSRGVLDTTQVPSVTSSTVTNNTSYMGNDDDEFYWKWSCKTSASNSQPCITHSEPICGTAAYNYSPNTGSTEADLNSDGTDNPTANPTALCAAGTSAPYGLISNSLTFNNVTDESQGDCGPYSTSICYKETMHWSCGKATCFAYIAQDGVINNNITVYSGGAAQSSQNSGFYTPATPNVLWCTVGSLDRGLLEVTSTNGYHEWGWECNGIHGGSYSTEGLVGCTKNGATTHCW